jgi:hypothetical protein
VEAAMNRVHLNPARQAASPTTTVGPARPPPNRAGPGFAVEAASIAISVDLTLLRSIADGQGPAPDEVGARVRAFVKEVFERHGIAFEELSPAEAGQAIAPGGEWSPESVAKRIVDFVAGFADGSEKRASLLRDAVEQGLREAEAAWGGELPAIAYQTMELVREGLDELFAPPAGAEAPGGGAAQSRRVDAQA